ncbi:HD domain-containing phosphohydrolase [Nitriliruptor alkaliphilus]|uniref:HD domain-containing phosphohydrolase n=1 Tax=Nitriliruptor alkaliphilus TaxID=427918 RepID=UPI000698E750|nr:HD domain-containing phosphohydrolase [Nitriliruptor alkaliphilus]
MDDELRLADLLAALSVATDLGMGQEPEKAVRACLLATELARACELPEVQVRDVYYTTLLVHLGCTASSHELAFLFGDDVGVMPQAERTDEANVRESLALLGLAGRGRGARRVQHLVRVLAAGEDGGRSVFRSVCEVGTRMAQRLHLGDRVATALGDSTEVWDGSAGAFQRAGDDIALPARFALVATQAVIFDRLGGPEAAIDIVRDRAGHWFDPAVADTFARVGPDLLRGMADADVWREVLEVEPRPVRCIPPSQLDEVARVFADMVDLKSTYSLGHSTGVAELAEAAAVRLGLADERVTAVRHAALLHDLGRVAVSSALWEQPRRLTSSQWEQVRLHPYHTERILGRSSQLAELARIAGLHHERMDGSGYHHGTTGAAIVTEARLLAAADVFQAMTQDRPHRRGRPPDEVAHHLGGATDGLDVDCVRAVIAAAGEQPTAARRSWPAGLTDREVEVLRLVASGSSNRQIANELVISPRTAEHHVQHIYAKIGGSTRAAAAVFAMEHGLVR